MDTRTNKLLEKELENAHVAPLDELRKEAKEFEKIIYERRANTEQNIQSDNVMSSDTDDKT